MYITVGDSYDIEANINNYKVPRVVKNFMALYKKDPVKRGEPFSTYYIKHREQAIMLFELFYYANDYETFYKTACWARDRVNEGMFLYSFNVAVMHREDMHDIVLPPFYEVYPFLFVENDVIQKAYDYRMKESSHVNQPHTHVIPVNFTLRNQEQLLSYFTEDVFLNAFNAYYRYMYPTWFNYTKYEYDAPRRGEQFYYFNQQMFARYMLERYSNDMPEIQPFTYTKPFKTPYNPQLRYPNGQEVPARPAYMMPQDFDLMYVSDIKNYEKRVADAVDFGYVFCDKMISHSLYNNEKGLEWLGQIVEGNSMHPDFYGHIFHISLNLAFDGVKIDNVDVGKLYTYFEPYEMGLSNAVKVGKLEDVPNVDIRARNYRLNHKPFTYNVEVTSEKDTPVYVRVFLGPKYNYYGHEYDLNERRNYFVEIDRFPYQCEYSITEILT
ncbi:Allergen Cr-PI [Blattella germanica]|nr:Allergen Cr-PI [Blattella germanica]